MEDEWNKILVSIATIIFVALLFFSWNRNIYWQYDAQAAIIVTWFLFIIRERINLHPFHFFLAIIAFALHGLGVFGFYGTNVLGMEYDFWMHSIFGLVGTFIFIRAFKLKGKLKKEWPHYLLIIMILLGLSTFHEIFEYLGAVFLGQGEGFLFYGAGDSDLFDTQKDFVNNLLGMIVAFGLYLWYKAKAKKA